MPPRRVTRREEEPSRRRLEGRVGAERARLVREHRAYVEGKRDRDANFTDEEEKENEAVQPSTPGRRPRMTVATPYSSTPTYMKPGALVTFYNALAKTPKLGGKSPAADLYAEGLAEQAAAVEEE
ncbi:hypothetical protein V7S43_012127 [Phytophthora oleae]|uniref:Uncharacterized protein n=1 Tax=Phytophthora oleae TaxID=2107226 RepID=A0ABD3F7J9_9STRA